MSLDPEFEAYQRKLIRRAYRNAFLAWVGLILAALLALGLIYGLVVAVLSQ